MIKLEPGNVLLKPSSRRQFMGWLRRAARLGQRLGNFNLKITLSRVGNQLQAVAAVRDKAGDFTCRTRQRDIHYVSYDQWKLLDDLEIHAGEAEGRPRVKFRDVASMLEALAGEVVGG